MTTDAKFDITEVGKLIVQAKRLARQYRALTGRPLGITGEIAEYEAVRLLNLSLSKVRRAGYDAMGADGRRIQIKGRVFLENSKPEQRLGNIRLDQEWDALMLVLLDAAFEPIEIYEASRIEVEAALKAPGSRSRNERGALGVRKLKSIAHLVWSNDKS
jgi:hypothetical protein